MSAQAHAFLAVLRLFAEVALFLSAAACIVWGPAFWRAWRADGRERRATTPGIGNDRAGLTRWTTVTAAEMQPFEEALRQVPVIDFEEGA